MSHITTVKLQVKDLDALEEACGQLGMELRRGKTTFRWYGREGTCEHAIGLKGQASTYEIGLQREPQAELAYSLAYDAFDGRLEAAAGSGLSRLKQEYAVACASKNAKAKLSRLGYTLAGRERLDGGRVRLRLRAR